MASNLIGRWLLSLAKCKVLPLLMLLLLSSSLLLCPAAADALETVQLIENHQSAAGTY